MDYKKNAAITISFRPINYTTGLTDLTAKVYDESDALFSTTVMTEVVGQGGLYESSFTPDEVGQWRVRITSATNLDDVTKAFEVKLHDIDDVDSHVQDVEDKIDIIDNNVDLIKTETDKIQTIDDNVDAIKTKTDNLPADTEQVLTDIKDVVDNINTNISRGGYFCN